MWAWKRPVAPWNGLLRAEKAINQATGPLTLNAWLDTAGSPARLAPEAIKEALLIVHYQV